MKRRGQAYPAIAVLLMGIILISIVTIANTQQHLQNAQSQSLAVTSLNYALTQFKTSFQTSLKKTARLAVIYTTQFVILNGFVPSAPEAIKEAILTGKIQGIPTKMSYTMLTWANSTIQSLHTQGLKITPNNPEELVNHIQLNIYMLNAFTIYFQYRLTNITIETANGTIAYQGDFPSQGYYNTTASIIGLEDPYLVRMAYGKYTRFIIPATKPYPTISGYYTPTQLNEILLSRAYIAVPDGMSFFERLEGSKIHHDLYVQQSEELQKELGFKTTYPIGLITFLVPDKNYDSELWAVMNLYGKTITNESSDDYNFMNYYFNNAQLVRGYNVEGIPTTSFYLSPTLAKEILGTTTYLIGYP